MKKTGLILATMLVALCILGLVSPAKGQPPLFPPKISLEMNGVPVTTLNIRVCREFTLELWIRDIPEGYSMVFESDRIEWDPNLMELVDIDSSPTEGRGWGGGPLGNGPGYSEGYADTEGAGWTEDAVWVLFTFHCLGEGTGKIILTSPALGTIVLRDQAGSPHNTYPAPFEVTVHQYTRAVGGVVVPVNKLAVLSPYLALIGLVGAVTVAVATTRRRKP